MPGEVNESEIGLRLRDSESVNVVRHDDVDFNVDVGSYLPQRMPWNFSKIRVSVFHFLSDLWRSLNCSFFAMTLDPP